jgi:imidazolonepropionase-like amidohydrolase
VLKKEAALGSLGIGKNADLLILDGDLILQQAFVAGVEHLITNN